MISFQSPRRWGLISEVFFAILCDDPTSNSFNPLGGGD